MLISQHIYFFYKRVETDNLKTKISNKGSKKIQTTFLKNVRDAIGNQLMKFLSFQKEKVD